MNSEWLVLRIVASATAVQVTWASIIRSRDPANVILNCRRSCITAGLPG